MNVFKDTLCINKQQYFEDTQQGIGIISKLI